jgi:L-2-hydroxyglutarate oxidase
MKILVVGGGLVGLGTAYGLQRLNPDVDVVVCEKESGLGRHQSTHNSGVLHAGLYYKPGSFKAKLAVRGIRLMTEFARQHGVAHEICGKIVVAADETEVARLRGLHERGQANGLRGLRWLDRDEVHEREPHVRAVAALSVPEEGIIDYSQVVAALAEEIRAAGGVIAVDSPVTAARRVGNAWAVVAGNAEHTADFVVNCGGLHSDRVARLFGAKPTSRIVPFRGDYFELARPELVRHLIYPVPDPSFPFLGVHFTRMIGGGVECGPTAVLAFHREGYARVALSLRDAADALSFRGLWRFVARNPRAVVEEQMRAFSASRFLASLQRLVPEVRADDLRPGQSGVRAQALAANGKLVEDFDIQVGPGVLHVLNAPSPGATASIAIGEHISQLVGQVHGWPS